MKFDTIIIGGGLSGLVAGIDLSRKGHKCLIVSSGQSALHFFSGSFELCSLADNPYEGIATLGEGHPYSKIGAENIADLAVEKINKKLKYSKDAIDELNEIYEETIKALEIAVESYATHDIAKAKSIMAIEDKIDTYQRSYRDKHIQRLHEGKCNAFTGAIFLDLVSSYERIGDHATNIAESVIENAVE